VAAKRVSWPFLARLFLSGFSGFLYRCYVCEILWSRSGKLGCDQVHGGDEVCLEAGGCVDYLFNTALLRRVEIDAWNVGQNVDAAGGAAKSKKSALIGKVLRMHFLNWSAKVWECRIHCLRICGVTFYEQVEVFGKTRLRVKNNP
jgi:hypothetical protein